MKIKKYKLLKQEKNAKQLETGKEGKRGNCECGRERGVRKKIDLLRERERQRERDRERERQRERQRERERERQRETERDRETEKD